MANNVLKVNGIAIADIAKINGQTDDDLAKLNTLEFTGALPYFGITWSTSTAIPSFAAPYMKRGSSSSGGAAHINGSYDWDGSSWSSGADWSYSHASGGGGGAESAGIAYAGYYSSDDSDETEEYNGTSWSTVNSMVQTSSYVSGGGNTDSGQLCTGGSQYNPTVRDLPMTQSYNGTTWSNESVNSNGRGSGGMVGTTDDFLHIGGVIDATGQEPTVTSYWNGSSWSSKAAMSETGRYFSFWGTASAAFRAGGWDEDWLGAPNYYSGTSYTARWTEDSWSTESSIPAAVFSCGLGTGDGESTGGGWTAGGYTRSGNTNTQHFAHYIASLDTS